MTAPPLYDFGGSGPVIHLALANGFPPQTYRPLLQPLTDAYHVVCLPPRALWPGIGDPPEAAGSWDELADDLLTGMRYYGLENVIAIGHSFGAIASMLAVFKEPERFRALCLLDPTILPHNLMDAMKELLQQGVTPRIPLVEGALNRRSRFDTREEAFAYWRAKPLFRDWPDPTLWIYTESITRRADDRQGFQLVWSPLWEAYYYKSIYPYSWDDLPRLNGLLPVLIVQGESSDTFTRASALRARELLPQAAHATLPGYGHLFPQAAPEAARQIITQWLNRLEVEHRG